MSSSRLIVRNIATTGGRTTVKVEPEFWDALQEISVREGLSINALFREIDETRGENGRTSACCVFILQYYRFAATETGHAAVGHGPILEHPGTSMHPNQSSAWKGQLADAATGIFTPSSPTTEAVPAVDVTAIYAKIGELTLENDFLADVLRKAGLPSTRRRLAGSES